MAPPNILALSSSNHRKRPYRMSNSSDHRDAVGRQPLLPTGLINYISGVVGGVVVTFVGHPFDTIKVRLQTQPHHNRIYRNTVDCFKKTVRKEGYHGLYAGVLSPLFGQMFFRAASFTTFHKLSTMFGVSDFSAPDQKSERNKRLFFAGGITGAVIAIIETPIDLIKTKLQTQIIKRQLSVTYSAPYGDVRSCVKFLYKKYGIRGLYQGFKATVIRNVPANAMFFPVNEVMKENVASARGVDVHDLRMPDRLIAGGIAGLCYWVGTCPFDVVKSQMMINSLEVSTLSWGQTVKVLYLEGGISRFYVGVAPSAMRSVPACGCMFAVFDVVKNFLESI